MPLRPPLRVLRLGNPFVRSVLRSRAHRLLSASLVVLEYESRNTPRRYVIPVAYVEREGGIVVLAAHPERKRWWRAFREPAPARLLLRGETLTVEGRLLEGAERREALAAYLGRNRRAAKALGVGGDATGERLDAAPAAIVAFSPLG